MSVPVLLRFEYPCEPSLLRALSAAHILHQETQEAAASDALANGRAEILITDGSGNWRGLAAVALQSGGAVLWFDPRANALTQREAASFERANDPAELVALIHATQSALHTEQKTLAPLLLRARRAETVLRATCTPDLGWNCLATNDSPAPNGASGFPLLLS